MVNHSTLFKLSWLVNLAVDDSMAYPSWVDSSQRITLIGKSLYFIQVIWVGKSCCHDVKDDGEDSQEK